LSSISENHSSGSSIKLSNLSSVAITSDTWPEPRPPGSPGWCRRGPCS
jgi:hypothetical protein